MTHYQQYKVTDLTRIFELVRAYPFAAICKNNIVSGVPDVVSAPIIANSDRDGLEFHIARANSAYDNFEEGGSAMIVLRGPNAHISPSWYRDRFKEGDRSRTAPTWDYVEARIEADFKPMNDAALAGHLQRLVGRFEGSVAEGWSFAEMDAGTFDNWRGMVAGFDVTIKKAEAILKLSQEQKPLDRQHVIEGLRARGAGFDSLMADIIAADLNHG